MVFQWYSVLSPALLYEFTGVTPSDVSNKQARTIIVSKLPKQLESLRWRSPALYYNHRGKVRC